jgi:hypothetical protein
MADHRITRSVVMEDASWALDCTCGLRFFGKDRAEAMAEWKRRCDPLKAVK